MGKTKSKSKQSWKRLRLYQKFGRRMSSPEGHKKFPTKISEVVKTMEIPVVPKVVTTAKEMNSKEWSEYSSHLMGSTTASSIFSPMWKKYRPLEIAVGALQPYEKSLMEVFEYYCFFNNRGTLNFSKMDSYSWIKLLLD